MRTIRRRNWLIRRFALGLAIAAVAAPAAQARIDEGIQGQPNSSAEIQKGIAYQQFVTDFPSYPAGSVADIGALPVSARDYALAGAERVRLAHSLPRLDGSRHRRLDARVSRDAARPRADERRPGPASLDR